MKIGLLYGGTSSERKVSIKSAESIYDSLKNKLDLYKIDFKGNYSKLLGSIDDLNIDVILNSLHGGDGENGRMQRFFEINNIVYTGSDSKSSEIAMDKNSTKNLCLKNEIPVPIWDYYTKADIINYELIIEKFNFACVVKPSNEGSSIGMHIINVCDQDALKNLEGAIDRCFKISSEIIVEQFIPGKELTASILCGRVLPIIEIIPRNNLYDYKSKYNKGMTKYIVPANISSDILGQISSYALKLHKTIGCRHYSRVDFRLDDNQNLYILEINTLPGMTSTSLFPKAAKKINISYSQLIEKIINRALND